MDQDVAELPATQSDLSRDLDGMMAIEALQDISEPFRAPLTLFYLQDMSYIEIAEALEIPIGTVMSRLSRGKAELRKRLADHHAKSRSSSKITPIRHVAE